MCVAAATWYASDKPCGSFLIPLIFHFNCSIARFQFNFPALPLTCTGISESVRREETNYWTGLKDCRRRRSCLGTTTCNVMYVIFYALVPSPSLESPRSVCIIHFKQRRIKQLIYVTSRWGHAIMSNWLRTWPRRYLLFKYSSGLGLFLLGVINWFLPFFL